MADDYVQLQPDSSGKRVDSSLLTNTNAVSVERQRIAIGDALTAVNLATVGGTGALSIDASGSAVDEQILVVLSAILTQLNKIGAFYNISPTDLPRSVGAAVIQIGA